MAYSAALADRIRQILGKDRQIEEKQMFGGIGFLLRGNMLVGVWQTSLIARIGPDAYSQSLTEPHVREFDITGRAMKGWVLVAADGLDTDEQVRGWIDRSRAFVATLPAK